MIVGDFNCVLDSATDRVIDGRWGPRRSESTALERLVHDGHLRDAHHLHGAEGATLDSITYWQRTSGARLDRAYVSQDLAGWVTAVERILPHCASDHCGLVVWLRDPTLRPLVRPLAATCYAVNGRDPEEMERQVGAAVVETLNAAQSVRADWDSVTALIKQALQKLKRDEKKRAARQRKRKEAKLRKSITTLHDLIEYVTLRVARRARTSRQRNLLDKSGNTAHLFRCFVQMDQRRPIALKAEPVVTGGTSQPMADIMATEWKPLFGVRHASVEITEMSKHCAELFTIPAVHRLAPADQQQLMRAITEDEVIQAIDGLGAHKAAGPDRIGNDFYKDWKDLVAPWLRCEFTKILAGDDPPPSFAEAIIVPIPKPGGDPTSALNFRPISLLPSGYKIFTKLLANRVQASLGKVINADQNGFVLGRAMADNINLARAILQQATDPQAEDAHQGALVLVDFRKAYDSIDREFVWHVLREFEYPDGFIQLLQRLHKGTSASFLVNGELSQRFPIVTGIRQGCPLAPLLFLIAAEALKHSIDQDPRISGIELRGRHAAHRHVFSAFVDDSLVYLHDRNMVSPLEQILHRFAAVSGLSAQPNKSHAIVLDPTFTDDHLGAFPVVPHGHTVKYLGVEIGIAPLGEVNWTKRVDAVATRLGILSRYTTGAMDRVQIINVGCVPSLMFTAQFFTPSPRDQARIDDLWRQFIWKGTVSTDPQRAHKIARPNVELPKKLGGLGLHDYRGATLTQAAVAILRWNSRQHDKYWEAFATLLPPSAFQDRAAAKSSTLEPQQISRESGSRPRSARCSSPSRQSTTRQRRDIPTPPISSRRRRPFRRNGTNRGADCSGSRPRRGVSECPPSSWSSCVR
jgi:hypothetical protein